MLSRLRIAHKLTVSIMAFIACIIGLAYVYENTMDATIEFSEQELKGNEYQSALMPLLYDLNRLEVAHILEQDTASLKSAMDEHFKALQAVQSKLGADLQFTDEGLAKRGRAKLKPEMVQEEWNKLKALSDKPYDKAIAQAYREFAADIRGMIAHVGDMSNLALDPDLDSYYLMDVTLVALPQSIDRLGQSLARIAGKNTLDNTQATELVIQARMLKESDLDRMNGDFDTSFKEDPNFNGASPTLKPNLEKPLAALNESYSKAIPEMESSASSRGPEQVAKLTVALQNAQDAANSLWFASVKELDVLLNNRIANLSQQRTSVFVKCALGLLASILFFFFVIRDITKPLHSLRASMMELADGKTENAIPYKTRRDEIGEMAQTLEVFQKGIIEKRDMQARQEEEKRKSEENKRRDFAQLAENFESSVKHVVDVVASAATEMDATSQSMGNTVSDSMGNLSHLASSVQGVNSKVQTVSAATEQLSSAIREISQQVTKATSITHQAVEQGGRANTTVNSLVTSAKDIGEVVEVINTITEQINLLALNATIEAARAGDAGKGFAVVASEVKNLANQTQKATEEIQNKVQSIQAVSSETAGVISQITSTINEINAISTAIAAAVEEQGVATKDIAENVVQASQETQTISKNASAVSQSASQTSSSANEMQIAANELSKQAEHLRQEVDKFLVKVRTA